MGHHKGAFCLLATVPVPATADSLSLRVERYTNFVGYPNSVCVCVCVYVSARVHVCTDRAEFHIFTQFGGDLQSQCNHKPLIIPNNATPLYSSAHTWESVNGGLD